MTGWHVARLLLMTHKLCVCIVASVQRADICCNHIVAHWAAQWYHIVYGAVTSYVHTVNLFNYYVLSYLRSAST